MTSSQRSHCNDHSKTCTAGDACYIGDADATNLYGFGSLKIDGCGAEKNVSEMAALFNASGKRVLLENCHNGVSTRDPQSGEIDCPMHLFRTSADIRPTYGSVISNLLTVDKYVTGPHGRTLVGRPGRSLLLLAAVCHLLCTTRSKTHGRRGRVPAHCNVPTDRPVAKRSQRGSGRWPAGTTLRASQDHLAG